MIRILSIRIISAGLLMAAAVTLVLMAQWHVTGPAMAASAGSAPGLEGSVEAGDGPAVDVLFDPALGRDAPQVGHNVSDLKGIS